MATSLRRAFITLAVAAGVTLTATGAAHAESLTVKDQRGDVVGYTFSGESEEPEATPRPNVTNGDIVRTVFRHTDTRVAVRVKFSELRKVGAMRGDFLSVVTNEGVRRDVSIYAAKGNWRGEAEMTRRNGTTVSCRVRHNINYDTNVVNVSFPRSCVSNPRWVRAGLGAFWANNDMDAFFMDDAQLDGEVNDNLALSKRLRRG